MIFNKCVFLKAHDFCQGPTIVIARPGRPKPSYATDNINYERWEG